MKNSRISAQVLMIGLLGCILSVLFAFSASAAESLRIASIFAFTGLAAEDNLLSARGVRFAVREINQKGGLLGKAVELLEYDNRSTPIGSKIAAVLAVEDGVAAIIGCAWSSHSLPVAQVAQSNSVPMITPVSTHPKVTAVGDFIFRVCFTDPFQARVMATFARHRLQARTGVTFKNITSDFSISLAREIRKTFEASGGSILEEVTYKHRQEHFRDPLLKAVALKPEVYFFTGHDESALILKEAHRLGVALLPVGSDGWGSDSFFRMNGNTLPIGYYCTHWAEEIDSPASRAFVQQYKEEGKDIFPQEALGYDAVRVLSDAVRRAGTVDRSRIRQALSRTRNFPGVTGDITFDAQGDPVKTAVIIEITEGKRSLLRIVHPERNPAFLNGIENE